MLREEAGLALAAYPEFDFKAFRAGDLTPVFFGSALKLFGVDALLEGLAEHAPPPQPQPARPAPVEPNETRVSGFVFKVQANMDPNHRDRVAFLRVCSGTLRRGMKLNNSRDGKAITVHNPITFFARDRELAAVAQPGDIVGIPNHGTLRVGDTLVEKGELAFTGLPDFAPEILRRVRLADPLKVKQMRRGLRDLAEEGVIRLFKPLIGSQWIVGVIGELQLEVLITRLAQEYRVELGFEASPYGLARWVRSSSAAELERLIGVHRSMMADDQDGAPVILIRNDWELSSLSKDWPAIEFAAVRERL